ncbi:MAG: hypothetical protein A3G76_01780 [Acidobacteria bacterium RIFCSPLOWO2_12_FULL_65_11]|nr:MAG: hypothetical protein A3H95_03685 [Acidobacteria bacterium RIFCSPLOWO2_02_FULL_64_15]OFW30450.1 MAG: hypothetical protein A3G76_01780 [Acidobacteria bacterium RIFCSPLOWO2_12_FULL_65_11]
MLEVTDLLKIAVGKVPQESSTSRASARYGAVGGVPPVVVWNVCRHCNLRCPHCYAAASLRPSRNDLSTQEAFGLIDDLAGVGVRVVIFSGGEPLLRPDLFDLMARARDRGLKPLLSSNGVCLDRASARRLADLGVRYVGVSLDGLAAQNDAYRGMEGAFARAVRGLRHAMDEGLGTGIRLTLTRHSADQMERLLAFAVRLGVHRFYLSHLLYSGRGRNLVGQDLKPAENRAQLFQLFDAAERLLDEGRSLSVVTGGNDSDGPLFLLWLRAKHGASAASRAHEVLLRRGGNSAGERMIAIDANGRVHPDQFWQAAELGDVRRQAMSEILAHPLRFQLQERENHLEGRCGVCVFKPICRGSHRERALAQGQGLWAPDPSCVMSDAEIGAENVQMVRGAA